METMDLFEIVMKLNGKIQPVGETNTDNQRKENLESLLLLHTKLLGEIIQASHARTRHEYSMKGIGEMAYQYLQDIKS